MSFACVVKQFKLEVIEFEVWHAFSQLSRRARSRTIDEPDGKIREAAQIEKIN